MRYILLVLCLMVVKKVSPTLVKVSQGMLRGHDRNGYISYEGIPYAAARERFKKAGPSQSWTTIRESRPNTCSLTSPISDCLQLDVHMPRVKAGRLPVLAWVKGGNAYYNAAKFVEQGIIVVIISHRFGIEGFLCSEDERIPGNAGLKDVVMALRWIKENIFAFRGNPLHVVVGGQSFGAAMVEAITLSGIANGLYRGVIIQSGSVLSPWAFHYDAMNKTVQLGKSLIGGDVIFNLINATTKVLLDKAAENKFSYHSFGICIEKKFKNVEQFLSDSPYTLLNNGRAEVVDDIPIMMGYNNDEANIFLPALKSQRVQEKINLSPLVLMPTELNITKLTKNQQKRTLVQLLKLYFDKNTTLSISSLLAYHRDAYFLNHIHRSARLHNAISVYPIYFYQFSYSKNKIFKKLGAGHSEEMAYLFPKENRQFTGLDAIVQNNLIGLWCSFIRHFDPTPEKREPKWEPMDPLRTKVYDISKQLKMKEFPYQAQMQFWDELYRKLYYNDKK